MANIKEQLDILVQLQKIDARIYDLRQRLKEKPRQIDALRQEFSVKEGLLREIEEKSKNKKLKLKEMELDLKSKEDSVKKLQVQLFQVKTNKEYAAMQKEIEGFKADNSLIEEEILKYMDEIDALAEEIEKEKGILSQENNKTETAVSQIEADIATLKEQLKTLESERTAVASSVEKQLLARYERVLVNKNGHALAMVLSDSCSGCNIELPPQVINEIRLGEKIVVCENCARILYIGV